MFYETTNKNGSHISFTVKNGNQVSIARNGIVWGSPQGESFIVALLEDIKEKDEELARLETELMMIR